MVDHFSRQNCVLIAIKIHFFYCDMIVSATWLGLKVYTSVEWELRFALSTLLWSMVHLVKYYMFSSKYKLQRPNVNDFLLLHQTREIEEQIALSKNKQEAHNYINQEYLFYLDIHVFIQASTPLKMIALTFV